MIGVHLQDSIVCGSLHCWCQDVSYVYLLHIIYISITDYYRTWDLVINSQSLIVGFKPLKMVHLHRNMSELRLYLLDLLKTKRRLLHLKTQSYRVVNTFHLSYKNQSVYAVSGTSRCLFSDKYKTHKYSVGSTYNCWMLNCWYITWPVGFKRLKHTSFNLPHLLSLHAMYVIQILARVTG